MSRLADTVRALVRLYVGPIDYYALYPATVYSQASDGTIEVRLDNDRWPPIAGVPIRTPFPDTLIEVESGARVLIGFDAGNPSLPYAALWTGVGLTRITVGASGSPEYVALANLVQDQLQVLYDAIDDAAPLVNDGGAQFKTQILNGNPLITGSVGLSSFPGSVAATKFKTE